MRRLALVLNFILCAAACSSETVGTSAAKINTSPQLVDFVLYAQESVSIAKDSTIGGGDVGVASLGPNSAGVQLTLDKHVSMDPTHNLIAPSISIGKSCSVGDVQTNSLTDLGVQEYRCTNAVSDGDAAPSPRFHERERRQPHRTCQHVGDPCAGQLRRADRRELRARDLARRRVRLLEHCLGRQRGRRHHRGCSHARNQRNVLRRSDHDAAPHRLGPRQQRSDHGLR